MPSEDPYADFRDNKGRFKKGHSGGPGRPQEWIDGTIVAQKWHILIEKPPRCHCGGHTYRFKLEASVIFAKCNHCSQKYAYDDKKRQWHQFWFFG